MVKDICKKAIYYLLQFKFFFNCLNVVMGRKLFRETLKESFNTGIGYVAGLLTFNYLSNYLEVRGPRNLWGIVNISKKTIVSQGTFEFVSIILSALVGYLILKLVNKYSKIFREALFEVYNESRNNSIIIS